MLEKQCAGQYKWFVLTVFGVLGFFNATESNDIILGGVSEQRNAPEYARQPKESFKHRPFSRR